MESKELRTMRLISWARMKGEILAIKQTYWGGVSDHRHSKFSELADKFIKDVEDSGAQE